MALLLQAGQQRVENAAHVLHIPGNGIDSPAHVRRNGVDPSAQLGMRVRVALLAQISLRNNPLPSRTDRAPRKSASSTGGCDRP